jgi:serine/threonine protein kinase/WD40 repeat protein/thioredoxin-like negative regulator of GroEL
MTAMGEWTPGTVIDGRYRVERELGKGGMGAVYEVFHLLWHLPLAVKTALPDVAQGEGLARFIREAESWVGLGIHPHVATAHYVRTIDGLPRIFLELVDGGSLHDWVKEKRIADENQALELTIQLASGLIHAHAKGLVHRDIKPKNVLVTKEGVAKVTDFGLVRKVREPKADENTVIDATLVDAGRSGANWLDYTLRTQGFGYGTPQYMAPELWKDATLAGIESDAYAFGVTLYEVFTGKRPFEAGSSGPMGLAQLALQHATAPPPEPSGTDGVVRAVMLKCLEKDPAKRFHSFQEIHDELGDLYRRRTRRDPPRASGEALGNRPDALNNRALSQLDLGAKEEARALLVEALKVDPAHLRANLNLLVLDWREGRITDADVVARGRELAQQYPNGSLVPFFLGMAHVLRGDLTAAEEWLRRAILANLAKPAYRTVLGVALLRQGRATEASGELSRAVHEGPADASAFVSLAIARVQLGELGDAAKFLDRAEELGADVELARAVVEIAQGRAGEARARLEGLVRRDGENAEAHLLLGELLGGVRETVAAIPEASDVEAAATHLERAVRVTGGHPRAVAAISSLWRRWSRLAREQTAAKPHAERWIRSIKEAQAQLDELLGRSTLAERRRRPAELASAVVVHPLLGTREARNREPQSLLGAATFVDDERVAVAEPTGRLVVLLAASSLAPASQDEDELRRQRRHAVKVIGEGGEPALEVHRDLEGLVFATVGRETGLWLWSWSLGKRTDCLDDQAKTAAVLKSSIVATAGRGGAVRLWDALTRSKEGELDTQADDVRQLAYARGGEILACLHVDGVSLWDVRGRSRLRTIRESDIRSIALSRDGSVLMTAARHVVRLWRVREEGPPEVEFHDPDLTAAALSPDLRIVVTGGWNRLRVWDAARGRCLHTAEVNERVGGVAFSPTGRTVAFWGWEVGVLRLTTRLDRAIAEPFQLGYFLSRPRGAEAIATEHSEVSQLVAIAARSLEAQKHERAYHLFRAAQDTKGFERSPEIVDGIARCGIAGSRSAFRDGWLKSSASREMRSPVLAPSGRRVYAVVREGIARWAVDERSPSAEVWRREAAPSMVAVSADGRWVGAAGESGVEVIDAEDGRVAGRVGEGEASALAFAPEGDLLVAAFADGTLVAWRAATREEAWRKPAGRPKPSVVFSKRSARAGAVWAGDRVELWDLVEGIRQAESEPLGAAARRVRVGGQGSLVHAYCGGSKVVALRRALGRLIAYPAIDLNRATASDFDLTAEGRFLATAGPGRAVAVWAVPAAAPNYGEEDVRQGRRLRMFEAPTQPPQQVQFSAEGEALLSAQHDGFFVWQLDWEFAFERGE